jgi:hypothetical protein
MLVAAFVILAVAVLLGSVLAVLHLQTEGRATPPCQHWSELGYSNQSQDHAHALDRALEPRESVRM